MAKASAFRYHVAQARGTSYSSAVDYTITQDNILKDGYGHFISTVTSKTFTLPAASLALKGISVYVTAAVAAGNGNIFVSGGFGNGGTNYDTANLTAYETVECWCSGTYWYALCDSLSGTIV